VDVLCCGPLGVVFQRHAPVLVQADVHALHVRTRGDGLEACVQLADWRAPELPLVRRNRLFLVIAGEIRIQRDHRQVVRVERVELFECLQQCRAWGHAVPSW